MFSNLNKANSTVDSQLLPHIRNNRRSAPSIITIKNQIKSNYFEITTPKSFNLGDAVYIHSSGAPIIATDYCDGFILESVSANGTAKIQTSNIFTFSNDFTGNIGKELFLINGSLVVKPFTNATSLTKYQSVGKIISLNTVLLDIKPMQTIIR